jgi:hypothetical protein
MTTAGGECCAFSFTALARCEKRLIRSGTFLLLSFVFRSQSEKRKTGSDFVNGFSLCEKPFTVWITRSSV